MSVSYIPRYITIYKANEEKYKVYQVQALLILLSPRLGFGLLAIFPFVQGKFDFVGTRDLKL